MEASHGKGPSMMLPWPVLSSLMISIILSTIMVIKCLMPVSNAGVHLRQGSSQGKPQADLVCDEGSGWIGGLVVQRILTSHSSRVSQSARV